MRQILFFSMKKKIKNQHSDACSNDVGEEVKPIAIAFGDKVFLQQFCEASVGDADDDGQYNGFSLVC